MKLSCCFGRGVSDNFEDVEPATQEKALVLVTTDAASQNGAPTNAEYLKAAGIGFLDTLDAVSKFAPKPVPEIVQLGVALIKAFDRAEATLESAKALRTRIEILIAILIDEVPKNEKGEAEIPERLLKDILQFQKDLNSIIKKINAIEKQRQPLLLVFQGLNEQKVQECATCLAASLTQFELSAQIGNIHTIEELKKRIMVFQTSLEEINSNMKEVKTKVTDVQETLQEIRRKLDTTQRRQTLVQRPDPPPLPHVFYGKDSVVTEAAAALTQNERKHLALIGQGGIGKTTTALAVLHDTRVQRHFTTTTTPSEVMVSDRRIWVSCIGVDTVERFEHALLTAVAGWQESPNARQTVINKLKNLDGPILVILDNFETTWDAPGIRTTVRSTLESLDALPFLSIFVTMRAGEPPCHDLNWYVINARAVDDGAARSIYLERRHGPPESSAQEDAPLVELLKMVGNHPLAITLLAASARKRNATTSDVLSQYKSLGTSMLGPSGTDQHDNMDLCVQVSINRLSGKFRDLSIHLLARLSMLPAGATMASFWLEDLKDTLAPALDLLIDAALVQTEQLESGQQRYTIHPIIRDYILAESRRPSNVLIRLLERAHAFLETHKYNIGELGFKEQAAIVRIEETNLQAVLLVPSIEDVNDVLDAHLNALLHLAKHYAATSPRLEVAERAVSMAKSANKSMLQAEALFTMGKNLHGLDRFPEAKECFESARELFKSESEGGRLPASRAADCLLEVVYELQLITVGSSRQKMDILDEALAEFKLVPDEIGVGRCLRQRGYVFWQACRWEEALEVLEEACGLLINSPYDVGLCHFIQMKSSFAHGNFDEGNRYGQLATELLSKFGSTADLGRNLSAMANGHNEWGHYQSAVEIFNEAIDRCTECGLTLDLGQCWTEMSSALIEMGKMDLAAKSVEEAFRVLSLVPEGEIKRYTLEKCEELRERLDAEELDSIVMLEGDV